MKRYLSLLLALLTLALCACGGETPPPQPAEDLPPDSIYYDLSLIHISEPTRPY